jgi:PAS domain S-box-containing protein
MRNFRDIPIRHKLVISAMAITTLALVLAGIGVVGADAILFRGYLQRDLSALVRIIGDNSTAALAFNDPRSATETLGALRARPHVVSACISRPDGTMLARYARPNASPGCPPPRAQDDVRFAGRDVTVSHEIVLSGRRIGTLMLLYDLDEISERIRIYGLTVLGVLLLSGVIAFLFSAKLRAVIARPITELARTAASVSETKNYGIRAQKLSGDETGVLVDKFNEMLAGMQEALGQAEQARERLRFMAESMPQKIFTATPGGDVDYFNRQWVEFTGLPFEQLKKRGWTQIIHPEDLDANVEAWNRSMASGDPFLFEHRFCRADGEYRWHLSRALAMRDAQGKTSMWIGSSTEIHEQKEKEAELQRANDDLQQFAYSASHDLQEPIRNVSVYSDVLSRRYHAVLDEDGKQFLGFLKEGGRRLATLIDDLLSYTRAGIVESIVAGADSSAVLQRTLSSLAEAIRESGATITHDPLPGVFMAEAHLQQVFQNLIGNALKYRQQDPPHIHIGAVRQGALWRFSVKDNGIGIDPQYKEKIFGVFKRLHRDQKYNGTGIGLAICKRVVERYGGRIWVESEAGNGSTFFFTVPEHAPRAQPAAAVKSSAG